MGQNCSCIYDGGDYESPDFISEKIQTARKTHKCCECRREIKPGEKYEYVSGKWDGCIDVYKTCVDCLSIRNSFFCGGYGYTSIIETVDEHISECDGQIASSALDKLTPPARSRIIDMIDDCFERMDARNRRWEHLRNVEVG